MRSPAEILFRLRQEAANVGLLIWQPTYKGVLPDRLALPDPAQVALVLKESSYSVGVEAIASQILDRHFPILGLGIDTGPALNWRRDYLHGVESPVIFFRRVPYLEFKSVGDHKIVWELNRHQHLVLLAQAYLLTGREAFLDEIVAELESWFEQNPFQRGINWASALEVAFRTLSWIWIYHLVGSELPPGVRERLVSGLYQHGLHLSENLSVYFSPNTHLLGEAVTLFALAKLFPDFPGAARWRAVSEKIVLKQAEFQVRPDGSHFEQSTYYHVYALDFLVFFYLLCGKNPVLDPILEHMAEYLAWLLGSGRRISFFGDDDGGRLFHPFGDRDQFGRATLATCGLLFDRQEWLGNKQELAEQACWWIGPAAINSARTLPAVRNGSRFFPDSGALILNAGAFRLQMDCGSFGYGGAGHSHSDSLSIVLELSGTPVLIDPGTYTYMSDIEERNWFRGSGAHNTVRVDGVDQATPAGPFRWASKPEVRLEAWGQNDDGSFFVNAVCSYAGVRHRRRVHLNTERLLVLDELDGATGDHICEQIWQLGLGFGEIALAASAPSEVRSSSYSPAYGVKMPGRCLVATEKGRFPIRMAMLLSVDKALSISVAEALAIFALDEKKNNDGKTNN